MLAASVRRGLWWGWGEGGAKQRSGDSNSLGRSGAYRLKTLSVNQLSKAEEE